MHYDSIVDPKKATIGVGLGLPGLQPGVIPSFCVNTVSITVTECLMVENISFQLADRNLMSDAKKASEQFHIEKVAFIVCHCIVIAHLIIHDRAGNA